MVETICTTHECQKMKSNFWHLGFKSGWNVHSEGNQNTKE